ncbi:glutamate decarboxylase [Aspergillus niger]|uniref:Glutamate decarboxylase n=1 Tax=Aspergillus niger TaxID=5061 RepID=A0A505HRR6_ASPNG|nr:glutamate decarboxylase [Aspergillus niger]
MEDTLAPFTPTDAERQQPLAQEYIKSAGHISDLQYYYHHDEPSSSKKRHGRSGSEWDVNEANAVRAIPLLDLPPTRIVPARFFPGDDQPDFAKLRRFIQAASIDDLKAYNDDHFEGNPYDLLFEELAELVTTYTSESSINRVHRRRISGSSHSSDLSTSSNEGKSESLSASALRLFARRTLSNMKADKLLLIPGRKGPNICKTRDAGGVRRRSGDREKFIPTVFAQEVSEMIGSTIAQRAGLLFIKHSDQEAFVVSVHGTLFYISAAYFSPEYIGYIETAEPAEIAVGDNLLWIRRSIHFDLKRPEDRGQALKFFWALVKYIASGEARSNMVAAAIDAARDIPVE